MSEPRELPELIIPGYEFIERLGSGGYGEVWRAEVPGGLQKAVKLVFGRCDQQRAASERRAMERIKALRHPFLLSLERIEIFDNRLVIVTELAEGSLRDRFQHYREEGLPGVPREELLGYLSDAADALDFICREHELQHLDVKPENLLIVGGHVKLADFGLVKELYTTQASIIGGMTPTYAAPELFQGRATNSSDQYSLAILYQELLTGTTPFPGKTAAELTLQHLNELPNLDALSEGERFVVSQALSKEPEHRFASCKDFLAALRLQGNTLASTSMPSYETSTNRSDSRPADKQHGTEVFEHGVAEAFRDAEIELLTLSSAEPCEEVAVPPVQEDFSEITPTLVVGLGRSAAQVMRQLRAQIVAAYGPAALPVVRTLLIDNDSKCIGEATSEGLPGMPLAVTDTVSVPLKRPQDYRNAAPKLLKWMSRRWLYNIPKSLCTEGIRPLGRLAVVDHGRQIGQRLRLALQELIELPQVADIQHATRLPIKTDAVRVYVIGSISAGIAGGGMLDVAYLARTLLERSEASGKSIIGIAMHATSRETDKGELGRVNAAAWLNELHHFSRSDVAYPGDDGAGLPGHPAGVPPFDATYLVDMGDRVNQAAYLEEIDSVANYLLVDTFTAAQRQLEACRNASRSRTRLRSFKLQTESTLPNDVAAVWAERLTRSLLEQWRGTDRSEEETNGVQGESTGPIVHGLSTYLARQRLDGSGLGADCKAIVERALAGNSLNELRQRIVSRGFTPETLSLDAGISVVQGMLMPQQQGGWLVDGHQLEDEGLRLAKSRSTCLVAWLRERIDTPGERIEAAQRGILWVKHYLAHQRAGLDRIRESLAQESASLIAGGSAGHGDEVGKQVVRFLRLQADQAASWLAAEVSQHVEAELDRFADILRMLQTRIAAVLEELESSSEQELEADEDQAWHEQGVAMNSLLVELDAYIQAEYLAPGGGFVTALTEPESDDRLVEWIRAAAVQAAVKSPAVRRLALAASHSKTHDDLPSDVALPQISFAEHGGRQCWLIVEPRQNVETYKNVGSTVRVSSQLTQTYTIAEAWDLSAPHIVASIIGGRQDYAQLATRVGTRNDVPWTTVFHGATRSTDEAAGPLAQPLSTEVMPAESSVLI